MTPALREKTMKSHGIYLSPSLSSRTMESSETLGMGNTSSAKEKIKDTSVTKITCSMLGFPTSQSNHNSDCFNLKYFGSQSSKHYPLLRSPNSFSINNKNCMLRNSEEHNCSKMKNPLCNSTNTHLSQIINSESREQIGGEAFSETESQNLLEMEKLLNSCFNESGNKEERQLPNCKWYQKNGFFGKASFLNTETKKGELFHQVCHEALEEKMNCTPSSKQQELNFRFLQCVNKQQVLLNRAKRTQKRLQLFLAKHVVKHCDQQMKCFVRHQLQRMKAFHDSNRAWGGSYNCTDVKSESSDIETSEITHEFNVAPGEIEMFAHSTAGLLSHIEEGLDSEATCSSSSEDDDEQIPREVVAVNCRSDWKWLVDRAKVGCCWTWLQAQISELEYKIQQLTDLHRQIRATKGMVILEEFPIPKDILKRQTQLSDQEALLNTTGNSQAPFERQDAWLEHDFEISPSSPTLLLRNIEKQSAQLSEIINSLIAPLSLSPTSSPLSLKSGKQKELVNGISQRDSENSEEISSSSTWLIDQQHLKRRRKDKTKLKPSSVVLMSTSARTRPLQSFQRRKLYRMNTMFISDQQDLPLRDLLFNTEEIIATSTPSNCELDTRSRMQKRFMLELDSSFHPVLTLPSDIPLHVHFKTLLKNCEIKGDPIETSALGLDFQMSPSNDVYSQYKASRQWKYGYESSSKHQATSQVSEQLQEGRKKRHFSETAIGESDSRFDTFPFQHEEQESHNHDMISRSNHNSSSQLSSRRRLRSESSYDIDNIVIPMSLVAPSKLEKLQYKEILTPSWRTVSLKPLGSLHEDEDKVEDVSDDAFVARHAKYEEKERARWSLWEQCRWPKRNRSYSRSSEGQDSALKEKQGPSDFTHHFPENTADVTSKLYSPPCFGSSVSSQRNQEERSCAWEHRVFPLEEKEANALICPDQISQPESSNMATDSDFDCTSYASVGLSNNNQPLQKSSADELEGGSNQTYVGLSSLKKQR